MARAIDSVLAQSYTSLEVIVVDDGSTDNTQDILAQYKNKINTYYQQNRGVSAARNFAVSQSKGEYLAFLDSDDSWHKDKLEQQMQLFTDDPKQVCVHCDEIWIRNGVRVNQMKKHKKSGGDQYLASLHLCCISPSAVVLRKDVFCELGGFREDYIVCEDYDLWLKLTAKYSIGFIDKPLLDKYGGHADQLSRKFFAMDYWRVKSLNEQLLSIDLKAEYRDSTKEVLLKKTDILLAGYKKHNNFTHYSEIEAIHNHWK